jgi:hypothetical protein
MQKDFFIFAAGAVMTALGVRLAATSAFWDWAIWAGAAVMLISTGHWTLDRVLRSKGQKLDPFLATAIVANIVAAVFLAGYAFRSSPSASASDSSGNKLQQPEIALLAPKDRYEFRWDTSQGMMIQINIEGQLKIDTGRMPSLIVRNSSPTPAQDATIVWKPEVFGVKELVKSSDRFRDHNIVFSDDRVVLHQRREGSTEPATVPSFLYYTKVPENGYFPIIAKSIDAYLPSSLFPDMALYLIAKMPEKVGDRSEPYVFSVSISWNVPDGGKQQDYRVKVTATNSRPSGIVGGPEIVGFLNFDVERVN